jgi:fumarate reductase (CoM/CoB) subunit B
MSKEIVTLHVYRFDPGASVSPHYDDFEIPYSKGLTVLDALIHIYENVDSSLSFRWSCKNVQCGTCGMVVNGEAVLACERQLDLGETVRIDPFPLPIIKDVVTDFSYIEDKKVRVFSEMTPAGRPEILFPEEVSPLIPLHKCLDCHICDVVCPLNKGEKRIEPESFLPADLVQLASMVFNKRKGEDHRGLAYSKKMYQCLTCGACVNACPVGIDIVNDAIEKLRQDFMKRDGEPYRKLFNPKDWVERWIEPKGEPFLDGVKEAYKPSNAKGKVGFFVGCLMNRRQQDLALAAIRALKKAQFDVIVPKNQKCCGQPLLRIGMIEEARKLLCENISIFEADDVTQVVTACPDCSFAFRKDYARLVGDGNRKPRFEVLDLISLLPVHLSNKLQKIACHNPCYLSKQGIRLSDELTRRGFQTEEVINGCCGAGGGVYFTEPDLAREISKKTVKKIGSDLLVTGCPFCKDQFEKVIDQNKKIIHYIDLFL